MTMNAASKAAIADSTQHLAVMIPRQGGMSREAAKEALRNARYYTRVEDITIDRIGRKGREEKLYNYDEARGFWPLGVADHPGFIRDLVPEFLTETVISKKFRPILRRRLETVLTRFDDPLVTYNAVVYLQVLTQETSDGSFDDELLGSYRSFVIWGIEAGYLMGDIRYVVPPKELVTEGLRRGTATAKIYNRNLATNKGGQWQWQVVHPDGHVEIMWSDVLGMILTLKEIAETSVDDSEDISAILGDLIDPPLAALPMDIDRAIHHAHAQAEALDGTQAEDHHQVADWLTELKDARVRITALRAILDA